MTTHSSSQSPLEDIRVNVKLKLAALWTSLMFLVIYVDYFHLYMPGALSGLLQGKAFVFEITQAFLLLVLTTVSLPALMIFLSLALPAKVNRCTNIIMAALYIPYLAFNLAGETWLHMLFGALVEAGLLCLILRYAWNWPRLKQEKSDNTI
ncbi:MAG: hypothetical protein JNL60_11780 [Bacteroidia bacterium]|nr:hypothetical protein [Bacteroidia bacterium]